VYKRLLQCITAVQHRDSGGSAAVVASRYHLPCQTATSMLATPLMLLLVLVLLNTMYTSMHNPLAPCNARCMEVTRALWHTDVVDPSRIHRLI
jgi:hypothetical protein